jgi:hypothetical protein
MIAGPPLWQLGADMYLPLTFLTVWLQARVAVHGLLPAAMLPAMLPTCATSPCPWQTHCLRPMPHSGAPADGA